MRLVQALRGQANLVVSVFGRSLDAIYQWDQRVSVAYPEMHLHESVMQLRWAKRMGWMLDDAGRLTGEIVPALP
ncbi:hypothetical protein GCM10025862_39950 [Arsenicicoccus piscis]|uniref:Uncharacterized protein n=1 Tax=Arsenicicoccus piscis TaxID=673954 RepID=A0ABQ6HML4_9MICO|nr:hypothetical protein GCM10025862_17290 [Arsenicicoccus piscis]GMA21974.1 hypothetical protein GCM10025862_39950 [Arsenicicoccus piscis]